MNEILAIGLFGLGCGVLGFFIGMWHEAREWVQAFREQSAAREAAAERERR